MKKIILMAVVISSITLLTGCSSILNGTTQNVTVSANVENVKAVKLYRDGIVVAEGRNAMSMFTLDRKANYMIEVVDINDRSSKLQLNKDLTASFLIGNLFFGGIPGWIIDMVTGSGYKFTGQSPEIIVR